MATPHTSARANPVDCQSGSTRTCGILRYSGGIATEAEDVLAAEEPLEIQLGYYRRGLRVHKTISVTMRTPGQDTALAAGFLFGEGIIRDITQIEHAGPALDETGSPLAGVTRVDLRPGVDVDLRRLERHFYTTSSCGVCGKASIQALAFAGTMLEPDRPVFDAELIHSLPGKLRASQEVFERTGGIHAAALFDLSGQLIARSEDVGRHNAVDKLIGSRLLAGGDPGFGGTLMLVSGRASFELMQKALVAGIPILAAVGAPSSLAVELAQQYGATLLGFVRDGRFNIYCGAARIRDAGGDEAARMEHVQLSAASP